MNASYLRTVPCAGCKTQTFFKKLWKKKSPCQPPSGSPVSGPLALPLLPGPAMTLSPQRELKG